MSDMPVNLRDTLSAIRFHYHTNSVVRSIISLIAEESAKKAGEVNRVPLPKLFEMAHEFWLTGNAYYDPEGRCILYPDFVCVQKIPSSKKLKYSIVGMDGKTVKENADVIHFRRIKSQYETLGVPIIKVDEIFNFVGFAEFNPDEFSMAIKRQKEEERS